MSASRDLSPTITGATPIEALPGHAESNGVVTTDIRPGDCVTIEMCVEATHPDWLDLILKPMDVAAQRGRSVRAGVNRRAVLLHTPKLLEAGSEVKFANNPESIRGHIRHVIGDKAWVRWASSGGYDEVVPLAYLERTPLTSQASGEGE